MAHLSDAGQRERLPYRMPSLRCHFRLAPLSGTLFQLCLVPRDCQRTLSQLSARFPVSGLMTFLPVIGHGPAQMQERGRPCVLGDAVWPEPLCWST